MSQKWFNNIDLQQNELQNGVIQNLPSDPSSGKAGQIYYNTTQKKYRYYNGTSWVNITADEVQIVAGDGLTSSGTNPLTISLGSPSTSGSTSGSGLNTYGSNSVTEDSHTHQISLPNATETVKGVIELATDDEATEGTDTTRAINAKQLAAAKQEVIRDVVNVVNGGKVTIRTSNGITGGSETAASSFTLSGVDASTEDKGVIELATDAEAAAGTDTTRAINAKQLAAAKQDVIRDVENVVNSAKVTIRTSNGITGGSETAGNSFTLNGVDASTEDKGVVQLASQEEVNNGTNTAKVITSATLRKGQANGVASLDNNGKIITSQLPDYLLGQVMYGGNASAISTTGITVSPSDSLKAKKGITAISISIVNSATSTTANTYGWQDLEGVYFICQANGTFANIDFETGDWIISTGSAWEKIDNTDSIVDYSQKSVQTFTGDGNRTIFDFTHSFGSDVVVQVYLTGQTVGSDTVDELVMVATHTLNNKVKLVFATAPTASQTFKVVIIG